MGLNTFPLPATPTKPLRAALYNGPSKGEQKVSAVLGTVQWVVGRGYLSWKSVSEPPGEHSGACQPMCSLQKPSGQHCELSLGEGNASLSPPLPLEVSTWDPAKPTFGILGPLS